VTRRLALALALLTSAPASAQETVAIEAEDGTTLWTDIHRLDDTPRPVMLLRGGGAREYDPDFHGFPSPYDALQSGAYVLVLQDTRGSGTMPEGTSDIFLNDGSDGRVTLEYIAAQSWSNGHVAMTGWSNSGIVDYLAAVGADDSLRGISPNYATGDLLNYGVFRGGVLHQETADLVPTFMDMTLADMSWHEYVALPVWDRYFVDDAQASNVDAIGLHHGGWFDVFGQGGLDSFTRMQYAGGPRARGKQKIVMGPWTHGGGGSTTVGELDFPTSTAGDSPLPELLAAWKTGVFTDDWTAWNALAPVNVFLMGSNVWTSYQDWPPPALELPLYFTGDGGFATEPGEGDQTSFVSDPNDPCPTRGGTDNLTTTGGPFDQRPIESRSDVVVFTSAPTTTPGNVVGRIHADVWIATDLPDVDVFVRLTDVYPDGRSMLMAQGITRARYRNGACPELLEPGVPTLVTVDMSSTAFTLQTGHAVRVIVGAAAGDGVSAVKPRWPIKPLYAVNPQNGDEAIGVNPVRVGTIDVLTGADTPSAIVVPVAGGMAFPPDRRPVTEACMDPEMGDESSSGGAEEGSGDDGTKGSTGLDDPASTSGESSSSSGFGFPGDVDTGAATSSCACDASIPGGEAKLAAFAAWLAFRRRRRISPPDRARPR
jgi:predicted acyl esterase